MQKIKDSKPSAWWLLVPLFFYFAFATYHLTHFDTADEVLWVTPSGVKSANRIANYWKAMQNQSWSATAVNDKPGITLAWTAGIGLLFQDKNAPDIQKITDYYRVTDTQAYQKMIKFFRLPILVVNGLLSLFFFFKIRSLVKNSWLALAGTSLILLNPILLGISQIVNPDSLLWSFSFAALLSFLVFLETRRAKEAVFASLFLGLALASKYTADIFMPFFFISAILYLFLYFEDFSDVKKLKVTAAKIFLATPLIIFGSLLVFSLLMPAVFENQILLWQKTILYKGLYKYILLCLLFSAAILTDIFLNKANLVQLIIRKIRPSRAYVPQIVFALLAGFFLLSLLNWGSTLNFLKIENLPYDLGRANIFRQKSLYDRIFLELRPLTFSLTPLLLFSILFLWIKGIFKKLQFENLALVLSLFLIVFYAAVIKSNLLTHIRYEIVLYPISIFLATLGIFEALEHISYVKTRPFWTFFGIIFISLLSLWLIKPFYFNYTSRLFPKRFNIASAWGYGGYEAAQYLNNLPGAKDMLVWSDYNGFCVFFVGHCLENKDLSRAMTKTPLEEMPISYYIRTRKGEDRFPNEWKKIKKEKPFDKQPVWNYWIDGRPRNYIDILQVSPAN